MWFDGVIIKAKLGVSYRHPNIWEWASALDTYLHFFPGILFDLLAKGSWCCRGLMDVHRQEAAELLCHPRVAVAFEDGKS